MEIHDIRQDIEDLWTETACSWRDERSKKYKALMIDEMDSLLHSMETSCDKLVRAQEEALRRLENMKK